MSAGTINLTNGSTAVTGAGVNFTTDLTAADFLVATVGGTVYSLAIDSITSTTALVLSLPFTGPTASGVAWQAVPRKTMLRVTAELNKQVTEALRLANENTINWQAVLSSPDTATVILPDGTTLTGYSWRKITDLLTALDPDALSATAMQIHDDAQQVATDKAATHLDMSAAQTAQQKAEAAQGKAETAQMGAETAQGKSETAQQKAETAQGKAEAAQTAAEMAAGSVHPENLLHVDQHLSDLTDIPAARNTLSVFSQAEIADMLPGYLGQIDWQEMRTALEPGTAPRDGQEVDQTGIFADLYAKALAGKLPTCTEAEWQADPFKRGCYVLESSPGKMRLPDDNGVQPGSLRIPVKVGDGGVAGREGTMAGSALPNAKGIALGSDARGVYYQDISEITPPFYKVKQYTGNGIVPQNAASSNYERYQLGIDLNLSSGIYQDGVTEVRPNRQYGCWTVRYAAKATNGGSIDALALATAIAAGDADLLAKIIATNARLDYALISPETNPALGSRTIYENPFGNNTPVFCVAEFYQSTLSEWINTGQVYMSVSGQYGLRAGYSEGKGIVLIIGNQAYNIGGVTIAGNFATNSTAANYATVSPVRIHVWKITS